MIDKPKTVLELFEGHPERWTQFADARNERNKCVAASSDQACKWCLVGALLLVYLDEGQKYGEMRRKVLVAADASCVTDWNDAHERTFSEVVELCRKAQI